MGAELQGKVVPSSTRPNLHAPTHRHANLSDLNTSLVERISHAVIPTVLAGVFVWTATQKSST